MNNENTTQDRYFDQRLEQYNNTPLLREHPGMRHTFKPGGMTIGAITPLEGFDGPVPTMEHHVEAVKAAERAGFSTLWVRDVPLLDPSFGDTGQMFDLWTYLGFLAGQTSTISLGSASAVLPLRHPIETAKSAASVDQLSNGRFLMGIASGDRRVEFPAFGVDYVSRGKRLRESLTIIKHLTQENFPTIKSPLGWIDGVNLVPKPKYGNLPVMMTGLGRQELDWIAANADGWLFYTLPLEQQELNIKRWRRLTSNDQGVYKPFAQATYIDLIEDPKAPAVPIHQGFRLGRDALMEYLNAWQQIGIDHLMINFKLSTRPVTEVVEELGEYVLPHFPPSGATDLSF